MQTKKFISFADLPPSPISKEEIARYRELGFTHCLITEDDVKLVDNGKITNEYLNAVKNIKDCHLKVLIRNMYNDEDYFCLENDKQGSNYGSKYTLERRSITNEFKGLADGFYMADEAYMTKLSIDSAFRYKHNDYPKFSSFDKLVKLVDWKNKYYPKEIFHINHVPSSSYDHYFPVGEDIYTYADFIQNFIDTIIDRVNGGCVKTVCLDNYPLIGDDYIESDYLCDLMTVANKVAVYNERVEEINKATFGICLQVFHAKAILDERHRDIVCPEEITFQAYTGMALGARLLEYFAYRSFQHEFNGILDYDGTNRLNDIVKEANQRIAPMENVIVNYEYVSAFAVAGLKICDNAKAFIYAKPLMKKTGDILVIGEYDLLVGCLKNNMENAYVIVNYNDPKKHLENNIEITFKEYKYTEIISDNGTKKIKLENNKLKYKLKIGDGILVIPKN